MLNSLRRTSTSVAVLWALAALSPIGVARADDSGLAQCIAKNNAAVDLRKQGRLLAARKALAECSAPACGADISDACQKGIAEISSLVPTVIFVPKNGRGEDVAGVKLSVDGTPYTDRLDGSAVTIDPGEHEFRFEVAGQPPVTKRFVLREHESNRREEILIGPPAPPQPVAAPPPSSVYVYERPAPGPPELDSTGNAQRTLGTLVLAIGLPLGAIATVGYGTYASTQWSSAKGDCNSACGPGSHAQDEAQTARNAARITDVLAGVTGVILVGGIVLRATAPARRPIHTTTGEVHLAPSVSRRGAGLVLTGSFL